MPNGNRDRARSGADLLATGVVAVAYFSYLIACVDFPRVFAKPVFAGGILPWGIVGGVALVVLIMVMAALYMVLRNRSDRHEGAE